MTYTEPKRCLVCDNPESLCQCNDYVGSRLALKLATDAEGAGDTVRVRVNDLLLICERAYEWGQMKSHGYVDDQDKKRWAALTFLEPMDIVLVASGAENGTAMRKRLEELADKFIAKAHAAYGISSSGEKNG